MSVPVEVTFTYEQALLTSATLLRAQRELEQVMKEDQGTLRGRPGTVGYIQRLQLIEAKNAIDSTWISA